MNIVEALMLGAVSVLNWAVTKYILAPRRWSPAIAHAWLVVGVVLLGYGAFLGCHSH